MRDLKADLELCNKATLGPRGVCGGGYSVFAVNIPAHKDLGSRVVVAECLTENDGKPFRDAFKIAVEDARFITQAHEGWPHAIERAMRAETLLRDILPMAMWESCMYKNEPEANPTTHCCDWNEVVERIQEVPGDGALRVR